jgi:catechol 2,3-dioxygenase-like lactoylglutathione lyase family enzyme
MLQKAQAGATLPAKDLARAREFYEHKLGFTPDPEEREGGVVFTCADGTGFLLFQSTGSSRAVTHRSPSMSKTSTPR